MLTHTLQIMIVGYPPGIHGAERLNMGDNGWRERADVGCNHEARFLLFLNPSRTLSRLSSHAKVLLDVRLNVLWPFRLGLDMIHIMRECVPRGMHEHHTAAGGNRDSRYCDDRVITVVDYFPASASW